MYSAADCQSALRGWGGSCTATPNIACRQAYCGGIQQVAPAAASLLTTLTAPEKLPGSLCFRRATQTAPEEWLDGPCDDNVSAGRHSRSPSPSAGSRVLPQERRRLGGDHHARYRPLRHLPQHPHQRLSGHGLSGGPRQAEHLCGPGLPLRARYRGRGGSGSDRLSGQRGRTAPWNSAAKKGSSRRSSSRPASARWGPRGSSASSA